MSHKDSGRKKGWWKKAWGMKNCVNGDISPNTIAATKKKAIERRFEYYDGGDCLGCKIVRIEVRELEKDL